MVQLKNKECTVGIDAGELVSFVCHGHEYIHQKGSPGWGSSDTEMFPIIGPLDKANFRVNTPKGGAIQDQHGLLRQIPYELISQSEQVAVFAKEYSAGEKVKNSKYPSKSKEPFMHWPYSFRFEKSFALKKETLEILFRISGEEGMPFMLGYHPAFKLYSSNPTIIANGQKISLDEVLAVGSRAFQVPNCTSITLKDEKQISIETKGFGHFMCWTEVGNMVCIEPISFYPYAVDQKNLDQGFQTLQGVAEFKVELKPKE